MYQSLYGPLLCGLNVAIKGLSDGDVRMFVCQFVGLSVANVDSSATGPRGTWVSQMFAAREELNPRDMYAIGEGLLVGRGDRKRATFVQETCG